MIRRYCVIRPLAGTKYVVNEMEQAPEPRTPEAQEVLDELASEGIEILSAIRDDLAGQDPDAPATVKNPTSTAHKYPRLAIYAKSSDEPLTVRQALVGLQETIALLWRFERFQEWFVPRPGRETNQFVGRPVRPPGG